MRLPATVSRADVETQEAEEKEEEERRWICEA